MVPVVAASLVGGALALDHRSSLRLMLSQPVVGGLLTGLALGSPREGFLAGAILQMLFLGAIPLRGAALPDLPLGGVTGAALYVLALRSTAAGPQGAGLVLFLSLAAALGVAFAARRLWEEWERRSYVLTAGASRLAERGRPGAAAAVHFSSLAIHFGGGFGVTAVSILVGTPAIAAAAGALAGKWSEPLRSLPTLLPFIGAGTLLLLNLSRVRLALFLAGFATVFLVIFFRS